MQNRNLLKPNCLSSITVSIAITLDGFSALAIGLMYLFINVIGGPKVIMDKRPMIFQAEIIAWITFAYLIICFISLIYWLIRKSFWRYVILGLGLAHLASFSYYFLILTLNLDGDLINFIRIPFYVSFVTNLVLFAFLIFDGTKLKSYIQNNNA